MDHSFASESKRLAGPEPHKQRPAVGLSVGRLSRWLAASLLLAAFGDSVSGVPSNAGLPPTPAYTTDGQLEAAWQAKSFSEVTNSAEEGDPAAETLLATRYLHGVGTATNMEMALRYYQKAATAGFALAQNHLAAALERGDGGQKDLTQAVHWYRLASDQGLTAAALNLGRLGLSETVPELTPRDAVHYIELAAEQGDLAAAVQLANVYDSPHSGIPYSAYNKSIVVYWLRFATSRGYVPAYGVLGSLYLRDQSYDLDLPTPANYTEAQRWFELGAKHNDPACQYGLAVLELKTHQSHPDVSLVREWLLKAAASSYPQAFSQLGLLCQRQSPPDLNAAASWYQRGMALGDATSARNLTRLTIGGRVKLSEDLITQLRQASDLWDMTARTELAKRYLAGQAQPRDSKDAPIRLLESASLYGNKEAKLLLSSLCRNGTQVAADPIRAVDLLFSAARYGSAEAFEQIVRLRERTERSPDPAWRPQDWEQAFLDYTRAAQTSRPEPALLLARRYLDGTYATNASQALFWYSVAAARHDAAASQEVRRLQSQFDAAARKAVIEQADTFDINSRYTLPGF